MKTLSLFAVVLALLVPCIARAEASPEAVMKQALTDFLTKPYRISYLLPPKKNRDPGPYSLNSSIDALPKLPRLEQISVVMSNSAKWSAELTTIAKQAPDTVAARVIVAQIKTTIAALQAATTDQAKTDQALQQLAALKKLAGS
jgi:hypothetical protein